MTFSNNLTRKNDKLILNIRKRLREFISSQMEVEASDICVDSFGVFIITEFIEASLYQLKDYHHKVTLGRMAKEVRDALYKFSFARLQTLLQYPGLKSTVLYFWRTQDQNLLDEDEQVGLQILLDECQQQ